MQKIRILLLLLSFPAFVACGKLTDKFSRINNSYTRVYFSDRSPAQESTVLLGGVMIYFVSNTNTSKGMAFGYANEDIVNTNSVVLPNDSYRVYAYSWTGTNPLEGQVRCGRGDLGAVINLSGAATTVAIEMNKPNCGFGTEADFGLANGGDDPSNTNFDTMNFMLCNGSTYPSCSTSSSGTWYVKTEVLGGSKTSGGSFAEAPNFTLTSACSSGDSGNISTNFRVPLGGTVFNPPVRFSVYSNASCAGVASGTYYFPDGLKSYRSVASGSTTYLDLPASSSSFSFRVSQYF